MKKSIFKTLFLLGVTFFITTYNKWYDDFDSIETVLTNGKWRLVENYDRPNPETPNIGLSKIHYYTSTDEFPFYYVFDNDGTGYMGIEHNFVENNFGEINFDTNYISTIVSLDDTIYLIKHFCKYYENKIIFLRDTFVIEKYSDDKIFLKREYWYGNIISQYLMPNNDNTGFDIVSIMDTIGKTTNYRILENIDND